MRRSDEFSLRAVDCVAEDPTARDAVRIHAAAAVHAFAARGDARNQNMVAFLECCHGGTDGLDNANTLMPEDATRFAGGDITL